MRADGDREALRLLMTDRDNAVQSAKTARTALAAVLVTAPAGLREQIRPLPRERRAKACAALTCPAGADRQTRVLHQALARLGQRIAALAEVAADLEAQISEIVEEMAPGLVAAEYGLGLPQSAAQILLSWSHAGRIRSEQAFAMLSGTAPVPVSSGRTDRHRLNRLGDRQLNRAIHTIAVTRMRCHQPTQAYAQRRQRRRQNRPRNPPLHQALPRPPPLPNPHQRQPQQRLTNIGASSGGSTSTRVHTRRSPSSRTPACIRTCSTISLLYQVTRPLALKRPAAARQQRTVRQLLTLAGPTVQVMFRILLVLV